MTARQIYEAMLIEMNKVEAPSMLLEDFNYFFNKAIYQYINKAYNTYDMNQQNSDSIRVLKSTAVLTPVGQELNPYGDTTSNSLYGGVVEFLLPNDYLHILNCICNYKVNKTFKCYDQGDEVQFGARRLTSDMWSQIINNFYLRPMYKRPYYFIHNVNTSTELPTNPSNGWKSGTDQDIQTVKEGTILTLRYNTGLGHVNVDVEVQVWPSDEYARIVDPRDHVMKYFTLDGKTILDVYEEATPQCVKVGDIIGGLPKTITIGKQSKSLIEKEAANRYGNASPVRMEIRYGKDKSVFELDKIYVDYIKTPQHIRLTQEQLDLTEDTSQIIEFPDYVCQEIINELVKLMMENASDPRLQTNIPINQSIAQPAPQQQQ